MTTWIDLDAVSRADGCDRCGVDDAGHPLGPADLVARTAGGPLLLCTAHHAEVSLALFSQGHWVARIPRRVHQLS